LATKVLAGVGTAAFGIKDQGFGGLLLLFYNQVLGLPAGEVGLVIMVAMVADALFDPMMGHISDHTNTRWGRRLPYMYAAALPLSIAFALLWTPPALGHANLLIYLLATAICVRVALSVYEIPSMALLSELSTHYDDRTALVAWRYFFGYAGGLVMTIIALKFLFVPTPTQPVGQLNVGGYQRYGLISAIVMFVVVLVSALGIHARAAKIRRKFVEVKFSLSHVLASTQSVLTDPAYVSILGALLLFSVAAGLTNGLGLYLNTYFWQLNASQIAVLSSAALIGAVLAFLIAQPISRRMGKKNGAILLFSVPFLVSAGPILMKLSGVLDPKTSTVLPILFVSMSLATTCSVAGSILAVSMVSDVSERVQLRTGLRSDGLMFSVVVLINKAVSGLAIALTGLLLTAVHFPVKAQPGSVPPSSVNALAISFVSLVAFCVASAIVCLFFYPITREQHEAAVIRLSSDEALAPDG